MRHKKSIIQALLYSFIFCTARQFETGSRFGYYLSYQQYHCTAKNILTPWLSLKTKHFTWINHKIPPWNGYRQTGTCTNTSNKHANISNSNTQSTSTHKYTEYRDTQIHRVQVHKTILPIFSALCTHLNYTQCKYTVSFHPSLLFSTHKYNCIYICKHFKYIHYNYTQLLCCFVHTDKYIMQTFQIHIKTCQVPSSSFEHIQIYRTEKKRKHLQRFIVFVIFFFLLLCFFLLLLCFVLQKPC